MSPSAPEFDALYRRHAPGAFRRARRLVATDEDAHEVVHDVFLSLLQRPDQYEAKSSLSTFLYSAITHACLNRLRDQATRHRILRERAPASSYDPGTAPERQVLLKSVLQRLPDELAQLAVYYYVDELTHADIARILGCSRRRVGQLLARMAEFGVERELAACR